MPAAPVFPDADVACLRHEEKAQDKANRRNGDRIDERKGETAGRLKGRRGDDFGLLRQEIDQRLERTV